MVRMNFIFKLINLAAVEMTKGKSILYWHELEGNTNIYIFFFQFSKNWVRRVGKRKNKKTLALPGQKTL